MVIGTPDNSYEDEMHHALGIPMVADTSQKREPLRLTVTPNIDETQPALEEPKEVHIVRHGETQANDDNTVRGQDPVPLNEKGRQEAEKAADELKDKGVDTIVASDLKRSRETAEIIGKKLGVTPQYDRRLRTWDVGDHTGQPCETSNPILKDYAQNKQDEPVPGGESFNDFQARSFAGIRDAVLNNKDKNLAIVTHNRVEATLKGWEKTGQENPDIDYNEVVKEETEPGTVRTVKFEPNATILNTFNQRFEGQPSAPPTILPSESFEGTPSLYHPNLKNPPQWPTDEFPTRMPYNLDTPKPIYTDPSTGAQWEINQRPEFQPISEKLPGLLGPMMDLARQVDRLPPERQKAFVEDLQKRIDKENRRVRGVDRPMHDPIIDPKETIKRFNQDSKKQIDADLAFEKMAAETKANLEKKRQENPRARFRGEAPDWFKEEMNDPETKALSEWLKNQFEGGPVEGEKYSKTPEDFNTANRGVTRLNRPANTNKELDPTQMKDPYRVPETFDIDKAWKQFRESHKEAVRKDTLQRAVDWNKAMQDKDAIIKSGQEWKEIAIREGHEDTLSAAMKYSENGKTAVLRYPDGGEDFVYHDGRLVTNPFK